MLLQMHRPKCKATWIMKNQANVTTPKETNKAPGTSLIEVEIYNLPDKEFKIIFVKTVNEMQAAQTTKQNQENKA